jgi:hypothetical protein
MIGAQLPSQVVAETFATFLGVAVQKRSHPGYLLKTRFVPAKNSFSGDEAIPVTMEITNVGAVTVNFQVGGLNRGDRDNQFRFTAYGSEPVPDTGNPLNFGGLAGNRTLKPGETFRKEVDVRKWFKFSKPGRYGIVGTYWLSFFALGERLGGIAIWDDYATASFWLTIK